MWYFYSASDFDGAEETWMWKSQEATSSLTNGTFLLPTGGAVVRNLDGSSPKLYNHYYWSIVSKSILTLISKAGGHARSGGREPGGIWKSWAHRHHQQREGAKTSPRPQMSQHMERGFHIHRRLILFLPHSSSAKKRKEKKRAKFRLNCDRMVNLHIYFCNNGKHVRWSQKGCSISEFMLRVPLSKASHSALTKNHWSLL